MPRYIDIEKVTIPKGFFNKDLGVPDLLEWLKTQSVVDVVSREDYEAVIAGQETLQKYIAKIEAEVASKIFEEIYSYLTPFPNRCTLISLDALAKLKKKYVEEKK